MGTFYENQLKRMFGESELLSADTIFSGKAMISKIGEDLRCKGRIRHSKSVRSI